MSRRHHSCGAQKQGNKQNKQTVLCSPTVTTKAKASSVLQYADHHLTPSTWMQSFHHLAIKVISCWSSAWICPAVTVGSLPFQSNCSVWNFKRVFVQAPPSKKPPIPELNTFCSNTKFSGWVDWPLWFSPDSSSHKTQRHTGNNDRETAPKGKGPS